MTKQNIPEVGHYQKSRALNHAAIFVPTAYKRRMWTVITPRPKSVAKQGGLPISKRLTAKFCRVLSIWEALV